MFIQLTTSSLQLVGHVQDLNFFSPSNLVVCIQMNFVVCSTEIFCAHNSIVTSLVSVLYVCLNIHLMI